MPEPLELVPLGTMTIELRAPVVIKGGPAGDRIVVEVASGRLEGDRISAETVGVANADWATVGPDGTATLDVRALLETDDGATVFCWYHGRTDFQTMYSTPRFETGDDRYRWLNSIQAVGKGTLDGTTLTYDVYELRRAPTTVSVVPGRRNWCRRAGALAALLAVAVPVTPGRTADAAPRPVESPSVAEVAFVGDSIGRDARSQIINEVSKSHPVAYYNAIGAAFIGFHLYDSRSSLLPTIRSANGPDILLVELGTGDAFWDHSSTMWEANIRDFLGKVLPHVTCVAWFNQKPTPTRAYPYVNEHQVAFNRILKRVLAEPQYADQVRLVDYAAWYRLAGDGYFLADLLHHNTAGRRELARLSRQAAEGCDPSLASGPFWDVPNTHWAAEAIDWLGSEGHATGYKNGTYRANLGRFRPTVSRVQFARMLWKVLGEPPATGGFQNPWSDSPAWADPALDYLKQSGVVRGITATRFAPDRTLSRVEAAQWLWRAAGSPPPDGVAPWPDTPAYAASGLAWIFEQGIMSGFPSGEFRPNDRVTRAQAASFLFGYAQLPPAPADAPSSSTTTTTPTTVPPTSAGLPPTTAPPSAVPPSPTSTAPSTTTSSAP